MTAQELKNSILQLAIQGKLLPQNPEDENASELIKRIRDERSKWIMEGRIKKEKPLAAIEEDEITAELPDSWVWCRVGEVFVVVRGITFPSEAKNTVNGPGFVPCATTGSVQDTYNYNADVFVSEQFVKRNDQWLLPNDIIMSTANSRELVGKTCIWTSNERKTFGGFLTVLRPGTGILPKYAYYALMSIKASGAFLKTATQTTNIANINTTVLQNTLFPLPPVNEQARIVSKIEELLPLVAEYDEVEQKLSALNTNSPEMLRKSILQQAVQGKLTARDSSDEPASELLKRIRTEKAKLIAEGSLKKEKPLPPTEDEEIPFDIPDTWEWVKLDELVSIRGGKRMPKGRGLITTPTKHIYVRVTDMQNGTILSNDLHYVPDDVFPSISQYIIRKDDVYIVIVGSTIGKTGLVPNMFDGMNLTENAVRLTPILINKEYLYYALSSNAVQMQLFDKTKQVGQPKLAIIRLRTASVPLPPLAEQQRIVERIEELLAMCDALK